MAENFTAKADLPICELKDRLDWKQALYELYAKGDSGYLAGLRGITDKKSQKLHVEAVLHRRPFANGTGFIEMYRAHMALLYPGVDVGLLLNDPALNPSSETTVRTPQRGDSDLAHLERHFRRVRTDLRTILDATPQARDTAREIFYLGKGLPWTEGGVKDVTASFVGFVLAYHPEFPEWLPEFLEGGGTESSDPGPASGEGRPECPYNLSRLTTLGQKNRFMFVFNNSPTLQEIKLEFDISRHAWREFRSNINNLLFDCEISFNKKDQRYEVIEKA